jgi:uncharacterized protein (UPF0333 family)
MASKIKNIIIFTVIAAILILVYIFFVKPAPVQQNLVSSTNSPISVSNTVAENANILNQNSLIAKDLLSVLLSVKNLRLDDSIFSNVAFINLHDYSIVILKTKAD